MVGYDDSNKNCGGTASEARHERGSEHARGRTGGDPRPVGHLHDHSLSGRARDRWRSGRPVKTRARRRPEPQIRIDRRYGSKFARRKGGREHRRERIQHRLQQNDYHRRKPDHYLLPGDRSRGCDAGRDAHADRERHVSECKPRRTGLRDGQRCAIERQGDLLPIRPHHRRFDDVGNTHLSAGQRRLRRQRQPYLHRAADGRQRPMGAFVIQSDDRRDEAPCQRTGCGRSRAFHRRNRGLLQRHVERTQGAVRVQPCQQHQLSCRPEHLVDRFRRSRVR